MLSLLPACTNLYFHSDFIDHGLVYSLLSECIANSYRDYKNCMNSNLSSFELCIFEKRWMYSKLNRNSFSCVKARVVSTATW